MRFLLSCPAAINYFRQEFPETLRNSYFISPQYSLVLAPHGFAAFSALLVLSASRNFMRALCN